MPNSKIEVTPEFIVQLESALANPAMQKLYGEAGMAFFQDRLSEYKAQLLAASETLGNSTELSPKHQTTRFSLGGKKA